MNKEELRKLFQQKRQELSEQEVENRSKRICHQFFKNVPLQEIRHLHLFLPIAQHKEVNTWLIVRKLREEHPGVGIIVSRTDWKNRRMENFHLAAGTRIQESSLGIPEPVEAEHCPAEKIDLVLLPLLAFDLDGNRLGYGAGFYDRFLANCHPTAKKIGLSLFSPVQEKIYDVHEYDIPMDACICPDKVYYFKELS